MPMRNRITLATFIRTVPRMHRSTARSASGAEVGAARVATMATGIGTAADAATDMAAAVHGKAAVANMEDVAIEPHCDEQQQRLL